MPWIPEVVNSVKGCVKEGARQSRLKRVPLSPSCPTNVRLGGESPSHSIVRGHMGQAGL